MKETLGNAIRRLRLEAGFTLRAFAQGVGISAAHQSDIEHGRRLPSEKVLRDMAHALRNVGGSYDALREYDARLAPDVQEWVQKTPGVSELLREVRASGRSLTDILRQLQEQRQQQKKQEDRS